MPHLVKAPPEVQGGVEVESIATARVITRLEMPATHNQSIPAGIPTEVAEPSRPYSPEDIPAFEQELLRRAAALTRRDMSRARDLVQDCMERAIRGIDSVVPGSNLRAWLYRILSNRFQDLCRHERTRSASSLGEPPAVAYEPEAPPPWTAVTRADIESALAELSPELRAAFEYREFEQLSYEAIGRIMAVPVATVGSRLSRARTKLRQVLSARLHLEESE